MSSCNEIGSALSNLSSSINGIPPYIDTKIATLLARIEALEAQLGKVPNDGVKRSELEGLLAPLIAAAMGGTYATKAQLDYYLKTAQDRAAVAEAKADRASVKADDAVDAKRLAYEARLKAEEAERTGRAASQKVDKVASDAELAKALKSRVDNLEADAAAKRAKLLEIDAENKRIKGDLTDARTKLNTAAGKADEAIDIAKGASRMASGAAGKADEALRGLGKLASKIAGDLGQLAAKFGAQLAKFAPLLALLGVLSTLLDVAMNTGSLVVLGQRIDGVERELDAVNQDLSRILGIITALKGELTAQVQKLTAEMAALRTSVNSQIEQALSQVSREIEAVKSTLSSELARVRAYASSMLGLVEGRLQGIEARLRGLANPNLDPVWAAINGLNSKVLGLETTLANIPNLINQAVQSATQGLNQKIKELEAGLANVPNLISNAIKGFDSKLNDLKNFFNGQLSNLNNEIASIKKTLSTHSDELARLASLIAGGVGITALATYTYGALTSRVSSVTSTVNSNLQPRVQRLETQVKTIDTETSKMPCRYSPALDQQNLATSNRNQQIMLGMEAFNTVQMASVQSKLGPQIGGGLSGAAQRTIQAVNNVTKTIANSFEKTWKFLKLDRILNVLTFAASIHNALMLSRSLGETLLDVTSSVLSAVGLKDANGLPFDLQEFFGKQFEEFIKGIVGAEAYEGNKEKWNKANRIISSAANLLWSMQSMLANVTEGLEIIGGWIARMANGMKFDGLVSDNLYGWFNPNPDFKNPVFKAMERLNNLDDAASQIYMISTNVVDFQDTAQQLDTQKKELRKAIDDYNTAQTTAATTQNAANESPDITVADKSPAPEQG